jgi:hypothetical protein
MPNATESPRPDWPTIKADYLAGNGSFRELAERHRCSFHTLAKRAKRESWVRQVAMLGDAVATAMATTAVEVATDQGRQIGLTAAALVKRTLSDIPAWLDRIEALANNGSVDPHELKALVASWRSVVEMGRETLGMREEQANKVHFHLLGHMPYRRIPPGSWSDIATEPGAPCSGARDCLIRSAAES